MNNHRKSLATTEGFRMTVCRGSTGACRFALGHGESLTDLLRQTFQTCGWNAYLLSRISGKLLAHQQFSLGFAACPNGCSRPQIVDFGVIMAAFPSVDQETCTQCGMCVKACRERAIEQSVEGAVKIQEDLCLGCKECRMACKPGAIGIRQAGFRVLVGGRLGRHPRLGVELSGLYQADEVVRLLTVCLQELMKKNQPGMKLATLVEAGWLPTL